MRPRDGAEVLTLEEAAGRLSCAPRTIRRLIARGLLAAFRVGRVYRIEAAALETFKARASVTPAPSRVPMRPSRRSAPVGPSLADQLPGAQTFRR